MNQPGLGAIRSNDDARTITYVPTLAALFTVGGVDYLPADIENQHVVGICTAISLIQEREKTNGKKYSPDFQYLLQKKFYDGNWLEGSSILNALKVGTKYGFLPAELWTHTVETDRQLPYSEYIAKLQAIPDAEVTRLLALCVDKIIGYAQVNPNDSVALAAAINESKSGILCHYLVGDEWWTPDWLPKDIDPLRPPGVVVSGHAIVMSKFDYTSGIDQVLANTWGTQWDKEGVADIVWTNYRPIEAWTIVYKTYFLKDLYLGMTDPEVLTLQKFLNTHGYAIAESGPGSPGNETTYFGPLTQKAVIKFQIANNIQPPAGYVGIITRTKINSMASATPSVTTPVVNASVDSKVAIMGQLA